MIKIGICDDEIVYREQLQKFCERFFGKTDLFEIFLFASGEEYLNTPDPVDILLLDIEMQGVDGLELKDRLEKERSSTWILFVSCHENAIPEAYGWRVQGFLTKPLQYDAFEKKMQKIVSNMEYEKRYVILEWRGKKQKIFSSDIVCIVARKQYVDVYTRLDHQIYFDENGIGVWRKRMEPYGFAASHQSYLVNLLQVETIDKEILLTNGMCVPISRRMKKEFVREYHEYLIKTAGFKGELYV